MPHGSRFIGGRRFARIRAGAPPGPGGGAPPPAGPSPSLSPPPPGVGRTDVLLLPFPPPLRRPAHLTPLARLTAVVGRYDVLHLHFPPVLPVDARWLHLIRHRIPVVHTVHNLWPHRASRDASDRQRLRRLYHACHQLIAHTEDTVRGLIDEFGVPPERIARIPHGNFRQFWNQERASVPALDHPAEPTPTILMFGELRPSKGADVLLRAAATLRDRGVAFRVVLAGAPFAATQPIRDLTRELDLEDRVVFHLRYVEEEVVPSYFEAASVVALPYRTIEIGRAHV